MTQILICSPTLLLGGTEIHVSALVESLIADGYSVKVVNYHESDTGMVEKVRLIGATVSRLEFDRIRGLPGYTKLLLRMMRIFRRENASAVHVQYLAPGLVPILAARLARVPVVLATVHQLNSYGLRAGGMLRLAARFCDTFLCVSEAVERSWFGNSCLFEPGADLAARKHWTIHNLVDVLPDSLDGSNEPRQVLTGVSEDGSGPLVGVVGRLRREKGQAVLLEALARLRVERPDVRLIVVGDGPDRAALEARARELRIADWVRWTGALPPEEARRLYRTMDVVAVPSLAEGFGLVAAEALAAGRPVVASDVGGLAEVVRHEQSGLLVPPGNPDAMAAALRRLLDDRELAAHLVAAGREDVRRRFSAERFHAAIGDVYRQLLARQGALREGGAA